MRSGPAPRVRERLPPPEGCRPGGARARQVWDERLVRCELGAATLRLRDVLEQRRFRDRVRLGDYGELDVEAHWLQIMGNHSGLPG